MKRPKKTTPKIREVSILQYQIECPHCNIYLQGGFNEDTIVYKCSHCENLISIDWDNAISVKDF